MEISLKMLLSLLKTSWPASNEYLAFWRLFGKKSNEYWRHCHQRLQNCGNIFKKAQIKVETR
jgi:hypothetical protein